MISSGDILTCQHVYPYPRDGGSTAFLADLSLEDLTLTTVHSDERWRWRDLPRIGQEGMHNPIVVWETDPKAYARHMRFHPTHEEPRTVQGKVMAVKFGNNRVQVARHLGYERITAMVFRDFHSAVKFGVLLQDR